MLDKTKFVRSILEKMDNLKWDENLSTSEVLLYSVREVLYRLDQEIELGNITIEGDEGYTRFSSIFHDMVNKYSYQDVEIATSGKITKARIKQSADEIISELVERSKTDAKTKNLLKTIGILP